MKITCNPKVNIAFVAIKSKTMEVSFIKQSDELISDMVPEGSLYWLELAKRNLDATKIHFKEKQK